MKKILIILVIIIAAVIVYINFKETKNDKSNVPGETIKKPTTDSNRTEITDQENPPEIPDVYDLSTLQIDSKLKLVKLKLRDSLNVSVPEMNVSVIMPSTRKLCDLFLVVNNMKKDMFYQVKSGTYEFRNVKLNKGKNVLEVFYREGKRRSKSSSSVIIRE